MGALLRDGSTARFGRGWVGCYQRSVLRARELVGVLPGATLVPAGRVGCAIGGYLARAGGGLGALSVAVLPEAGSELGASLGCCSQWGAGWGTIRGCTSRSWGAVWVPYQGITAPSRGLVGGTIHGYTVYGRERIGGAIPGCTARGRGRVVGAIGCCSVRSKGRLGSPLDATLPVVGGEVLGALSGGYTAGGGLGCCWGLRCPPGAGGVSDGWSEERSSSPRTPDSRGPSPPAGARRMHNVSAGILSTIRHLDQPWFPGPRPLCVAETAWDPRARSS